MPMKDIVLEKITIQKFINSNFLLQALLLEPDLKHLYCYALNNPIVNSDALGLFPCPKGQHLEKDSAGFYNCMVQNHKIVAACTICAVSAVTGVGTPIGLPMCLACLGFELNCAAKHSKCVPICD